MNRRSFLAAGLGLATVGALPAFAAGEPFFRRHGLPIGIQLYSLGNDVLDDIPGNFATVKTAGYQAVEMPFEFGNLDPKLLKAQLDRADLTCPSAQSELGPDLDLSKLADGLHYVGADTCISQDLTPELLGTPLGFYVSVKQRQQLMHRTADEWRRAADWLNEKGAALKERGIKLCYHNHNFEFAPVGDTYGWDILIKNTEPGAVYFQLDIGWCATAGKDPVAIFSKDKGRYWSAHVKDIKASTPVSYMLHSAHHSIMDNAVVGQGKLDWPTILAAAYEAGVRRYFVEHEDPNRTFAAIKATREYLSRVVA
jgi:sugar phosphate isomerase/epimerase